MKTSITFNKVINDAGQLALTEGHTVLTSSPRVTPCGLLSLKGEIVKTQKYYTLVALTTNEETQSVFWEIIFGDYDRKVVERERFDIENAEDVFHTSTFKIITTSDKQADIDLAVKCLNEKICWVCEGKGRGRVLLPFGVYDGFTKERIEECLHCKGTGDLAKGTPEAISEVQTWPWDTVIHQSLEGGTLSIPGTDIVVIYDYEAKVYRRDPSYEYLPNAEHVYAWSRT